MWEYLVNKNAPIQKQNDTDIKPVKKTTDSQNTQRVEQEGESASSYHQSKVTSSSRANRVLQCPVCQQNMNREYISQIEIDRCPGCGGIFLDKGELDLIHPGGHSSYAPQSGQAKAPNPDRPFLIYSPHGLTNKLRE